MASQITNHKCIACTGPLRFDGATARLQCDFCGASYTVQEIEAHYAEKEVAASQAGVAAGIGQETQAGAGTAEVAGATAGAAGATVGAAGGVDPSGQAQGQPADWGFQLESSDWSSEEAASLRAYNCNSCGAEIICDHTTAATSCPYCDNPVVVPAQFHGMLRPDYVIPFRLDKEAAKAALKNYYKNKKLLPKTFSDHNHIEEIKGIYVPFWLFDASSQAHYNFKATRVHVYTRGDEEITTTDHYRIVRQGSVDFVRIPVDGSTQMPDAHMDAIEPFDYNDLQPFSTAYLPGFLADKYDVDAKASEERARERILNSTREAFRNSVSGYHLVTLESENTQLQPGDVKYALLPVWLLATKWKDKNFLFAMNGQTGKLIGDLPVDRGRFWAWFFGIALPLMAVLSLVFFVFWRG